MPRAARLLTREPASGGRSRTRSALPRKSLHVDDPLQGDRVAPVLGFEREGGVSCARTDLGGSESLLERVCARRRDERAHDLPAVERDLDPNPLWPLATGNHLREDAVDGIRVDERHLEPEEALARGVVDQVCARVGELGERRIESPTS